MQLVSSSASSGEILPVICQTYKYSSQGVRGIILPPWKLQLSFLGCVQIFCAHACTHTHTHTRACAHIHTCTHMHAHIHLPHPLFNFRHLLKNKNLTKTQRRDGMVRTGWKFSGLVRGSGSCPCSNPRTKEEGGGFLFSSAPHHKCH